MKYISNLFLFLLLSSSLALAGGEGDVQPAGTLVYQYPPSSGPIAGAEGAANAANAMMGVTGQSMPTPNFSSQHQQIANSNAAIQGMNQQIESLQDIFRRYDTPIETGRQLEPPRNITTTDRVAMGMNKWLDKKVAETSATLTNKIHPTLDSSRLKNEITSWKNFTQNKKTVLALGDKYSIEVERLRTQSGSITNRDVYTYSLLAFESGLSSLADAAQIEGGSATGDYAERLGVSEAQYEIGKALLDVGLSFTPGVSVGKDAYEALTGRSVIDGAELDITSRSFAVLGVATMGGSNIVKNSFKGLIKIAEAAHARSLLAHGFESAIKLTESNVANIVRHDPFHNLGALHAKDLPRPEAWKDLAEIPREWMTMQKYSDTFRSATYISYELTESKSLWRVASAAPESLEAIKDFNRTWGHKSNFWTSVMPNSPTQAMIDTALERSWGSRANVLVRIEAPAGTILNEGRAAGLQRIGTNMSEFVGGGNQIVITDAIPKEWIKEIRHIAN